MVTQILKEIFFFDCELGVYYCCGKTMYGVSTDASLDLTLSNIERYISRSLICQTLGLIFQKGVTLGHVTIKRSMGSQAAPSYRFEWRLSARSLRVKTINISSFKPERKGVEWCYGIHTGNQYFTLLDLSLTASWLIILIFDVNLPSAPRKRWYFFIFFLNKIAMGGLNLWVRGPKLWPSDDKR